MIHEYDGDTGLSEPCSSDRRSGSETQKEDEEVLRGSPPVKKALRRRVRRPLGKAPMSDSPPSAAPKATGSGGSKAGGECQHCSSAKGPITRLFAEPAASEAPTEGTAGHVQARTQPHEAALKPQQQRQLEDAAYEASLRRCIGRLARVLRVLCMLLTPLLLLLLLLGPYVFTQLPPTARQLATLAFPALRLLAAPLAPARKHPCPPGSGETLAGLLGSLFSLQRGCPAADSSEAAGSPSAAPLPSPDSLKQEFSAFSEGSVSVPPLLLQHTSEFEKEILKVADGVYVALGFGLANCVILQGPEGIVLVDTMESTETMEAVWAAWTQLQQQQQQQQQQVKGIIYTHFHTDHTFGAAAVYTEGVTEVHAHVLTKTEMEKVLTVTGGSTYRRSMRQFGVYIQSADFVHAGIGPKLHYDNKAGIGSVLPTHVMTESRKTLKIAGLTLELIHAPGESRDQTVVWLPQQQLLIGADNIYKSLPNIYAIRGTETRNCNDWVSSLDLMRSLEAEILVLGHTRPLFGKELIQQTLMAYRDAIQFLHDQTVRLMNKGLHLSDIVHSVHLPQHLAGHPFLQPLYGTVPWTVRAIFTHYMGWFSGSAEELSQLSAAERAEALQDLAGGRRQLLNKTLQALRDGRLEWALETATAAETLDPDDETARLLKVLALRALAANQTAATGRNWYLTSALEAEGTQLLLSDQQKRQVLQRLNMGQVFDLLPVRIIPEAAETLDSAILFKFAPEDRPEDVPAAAAAPAPAAEAGAEAAEAAASKEGDISGNGGIEQHCVHFRRGIVYTRSACEKPPDATVETTAAAWLRILTRETGPVAAAARGDIKVYGSLMLLVKSLAAVELDAD